MPSCNHILDYIMQHFAESEHFFYIPFLQELAFIRGLKRAATVVCLERTELLSVEKVDFFSAKIDLTFNADMQRRVEYLK